MKINKNYLSLKESYLFAGINKKVAAYQSENPDKKIIRLGIGDVTLPLADEVVNAMAAAAEEQRVKETFKGYGPEQGYNFLKEALQRYYLEKGVTLETDEIFISDGAKSDLANVLDIFAPDNVVLIPNPVYPAYLDTNTMLGNNVMFMDANIQNNFLPMPDRSVKADIIYLCSPNNPTGAAYNKAQLREWVDYALEAGAVILYDAAYEGFVRDQSLCRSIYQVEGAKKCAIELSSLSKTAGFTGTRCGYTVVPYELVSEGVQLNKLWLRRQTTKFNGVPYIVQKGAEAVFTPKGREQVSRSVDYYMDNAKLIADAMTELGIWFSGGENSPYIWLKCPNGMGSWEFFDLLLEEANVVGTPGSGFGTNGEGFFRLTGFGSRENTVEAVKRIKAVLQK